MAATPFIVTPEDYADALDLVGERITVLASGKATQGYEIFLQRGPEGSGPPPHSHLWDESFYVVGGRIDFGIGAAEAMWKGKPVIGAAVGGLTQLIIRDVTGYTVHSAEGAAFRIRHLLNNPELIPRMGAAGREHIRRGFLITRHLIDYLGLMTDLGRGTRSRG